MKKKLVLINVPARHPKEAKDFYSKFLGVEFARTLTDEPISYETFLTNDGLRLVVNTRMNDMEPIMCYFAVDDLSVAVKEIEDAGGKVLANSIPIRISPKGIGHYKKMYEKEVGVGKGREVTEKMGTGAVVLDPDGNAIGFVQLEKHAHVPFKYGKHAEPMSQKNKKRLEDAIAAGKALEQD